MRMPKLFALCALLYLPLCGLVIAEPRINNIDLVRRTLLTVYVVPDLGTRFTFPFILDEQDDHVPFTLHVTNPAFVNVREKGRNYFLITAPVQGVPDPGKGTMLGNVFVTVAGYEISIELRTTTDLGKHYSDIVFVQTAQAREVLIQKAIRERTAALESEYKNKFAALDKTAEYKAVALVGKLALQKPKTNAIKEEAKLKLPGGDSVVLYVANVVRLEGYSIFVFEVEAESSSKGLTILDAKLFSLHPDTKFEQALDAAKDVPERVPPARAVKGTMTVLDSAINPAHLLKLKVVTDKGTVEAVW